MMHRCVIVKYRNGILFSYQEDDRPLELQFFSENALPVGSIILGRIEKICPNISASFVNLGGGAKGFLPTTDYREGDLVPVQMIRSGSRRKDPMLSTDLSISGVTSVVYPGKPEIKVSRKMTPDRRSELRSGFQAELSDLGCGVILRTNAAECDFAETVSEIRRNAARLEKILATASMRKQAVLYRPPEEWLLALSNLYTDQLDEIVTDDPGLFDAIDAFCRETKAFSDVRRRFYQDRFVSLLRLYSLESRLQEALHHTVWLKSGAFIVIEPTEALVAIDVNSGKTQLKREREETLFGVNLEAAEEIARQLRLRNLSGIILIDFINMSDLRHRSELLSAFRKALKNDRIKTQVHGMTSLGLVEMTRMKGRSTLYEQAGSIAYDAVVSADKRRV